MEDNKKREQEINEELENTRQDGSRNLRSEEPDPENLSGQPSSGKENGFKLDDIDFDKAYDQISKEPISDEETKKRIQKAREDALREEKRLEKVKRKNKTRWLRVLLFTLSIIAVSLALAWIVMVGVRDILGTEKELYSTVEIEVEAGQTADQVADLLGEKEVVSYPWLFKIVVKLDGVGDTFQSGTHEFYPHASYAEIVAELQKANVVNVTITEGMNLVEVARELEEKGVCSADEFIRTVNTAEFDYSFMEEVGGDPLKFYKMEGYLFPDKYEFYKNDKPENVAKKFFDNFQKKVSPYFDQMKEKGMTLEETIILASIIQSEAATEAQMPGISSVFHNRLNNLQAYPHLETDPTIKYVEEVIKPNIGTANQAMYDAYNTKVRTGLPVGPISNPGIKAIEAALNPERTNYYFFVHNVKTGECLYASTYAQHQANCRKLGITGA